MTGTRGGGTSAAPRTRLLDGLAIIWQETPARLVVLALVSIVLGAAPACTTVLAGVAIAAAPDRGRMITALVGFVAVQALAEVAHSLVFPFTEAWALDIYGRLERRTMAALSDPPLLDHLLDPTVAADADLAGRQAFPNSYSFASALPTWCGWSVGLLGSFAMVASFSVPLAVAMTALWGVLGHRTRRAMAAMWDEAGTNTRRAIYLRRLAVDRTTASELRIFGLSGWFLDAYRRAWRTAMDDAWATRRLRPTEAAMHLGLPLIGNAASFALAIRWAQQGRVSLGGVTVLIGGLAGLSTLAVERDFDQSMAKGSVVFPALRRLEAAARREVTRTVPATPIAVPLGAPVVEIRFADVGFVYPGADQRPVLEHLDLVIPAGTSLAIVGVNGAGKTTIVKLLARLHDPTSGRITVDGIDLRDLDPRAWQARVAAIFQDFQRYPLSLERNVAFGGLRNGGESAGGAATDAAVESAGAAQLVAGLPHGSQTVLSRRYVGGVDLSGGQWQRVALARAIHGVRSGASVLVLDEPTANLDVRGEAELFDHYLSMTAGATTLLISHRFSTVRRADRIVVLDGGRVTESGTHEELLAGRGTYGRLFSMQAASYAPIEDEIDR